MHGTSPRFQEIRSAISGIPVVDCHDHIARREKVTDIYELVVTFYLGNDFATVVGESGLAFINDQSHTIAERYELFSRAWDACKLSSYGTATRRALTKLFDDDDPTLDNLERWARQMPDFSRPEVFDTFISESGIVASISDNWPEPAEVWNGTWNSLPWQQLAIALPPFHDVTSRDDITRLERPANRTVTSLAEYEQLCADYFQRWIALGAVAMKDQSAYMRSLDYGLPTRSDAERVFNRILAENRYRAEYDPHDNVLSDYLFHSCLRMAREMELPVQLHTGHMAGPRNDVRRANASLLTSVLEIHRDVHFDLFHGNWPYSGELLFLAKNYENVSIDMCWAPAVDPLYARDLLRRALVTVPRTKIHAFGSDVTGTAPQMVWAYAELMRDVVAAALAESIDEGLVTEVEAVETARMWLLENPTNYFNLDAGARATG